MNTFQFIASLVNSSAWPIALVVSFVILRKPIASVIKSIRRLSWKDASADFGEDIAKLEEQYQEQKEPVPLTLRELKQDDVKQETKANPNISEQALSSKTINGFDVLLEASKLDNVVFNSHGRHEINKSEDILDEANIETEEIKRKLEEIESTIDDFSNRLTNLEHRKKPIHVQENKFSQAAFPDFFNNNSFEAEFNREVLALAEINPASAIAAAWLRIENEVFDINKFLQVTHTKATDFKSNLETLLDYNIIDEPTSKIILTLRVLRNKAVHYPTSDEITYIESIEYARLLRKIINDLQIRVPVELRNQEAAISSNQNDLLKK